MFRTGRFPLAAPNDFDLTLLFDWKGAYGGSVSSTAELYKNREADQCNPNLYNFNIYHTIDEEKVSKSVEHLYDEIKHKNREQGESMNPLRIECCWI